MIVNTGSFRDPSGQVFESDGVIYRNVFGPGVSDFEAARDAGIYDRLIEAGTLIPHEEVVPGSMTPEGTFYCLRHPRLPMVSYPWEWPFSMLKDAALVHLEAMEQMVPAGFWLRDASVFNAQFDGDGIRLIDTLSIGKRVPDSPWVAYGQFCGHFLGPLALAAYGDIRTLSLWRGNIDGYPLDLVLKMLPFWRRYRPGILMHLTLHARAQGMADKKEDIGKAKQGGKPKISDRGLLGIVHSLRRTIEGIRWKPTSKIWDEYTDIRTYATEDVSRKSEYVEKVVKRIKPGVVWDLGSNTGEFSLIAAAHGAFVVSIDGDPGCTESLYQRVAGDNKVKGVLPLTMDLANPSPGLGWDSQERFSLGDRGPADLIFALALVHHLVLSCCVPLGMIADWFAGLGEHLLAEFVPADDPMVRKLLRNHSDQHLPYSLEIFKSSFGEIFDFIDHMSLQNGRTLYLCRRKNR
jgi:hypothetical protein